MTRLALRQRRLRVREADGAEHGGGGRLDVQALGEPCGTVRRRRRVQVAGRRSTIGLHRLGVRLTDADIALPRRRLTELADEFAERDDAGGQPISLLLLAHRRRE